MNGGVPPVSSTGDPVPPSSSICTVKASPSTLVNGTVYIRLYILLVFTCLTCLRIKNAYQIPAFDS